MNIGYTLICGFFLSVGSAGFLVYSAKEGENITVQCSLSPYRSRKFFCIDKCRTTDILIETTENRARNGRYSIKSQNQGFQQVTITQLSKSDSGTYYCGSGTLITTTEKLEIIVTDAYLDGSSEVKPLYKRSGEDVTVECVFANPGTIKSLCREEAGEKMNILLQTTGDKRHRGRYSIVFLTGSQGEGFVFVTITELIRSDSGRYRCSVGGESYRHFDVVVTDESSFTRSPASPETTEQSETQTLETTRADTKHVMLTVGLTLVVMVVLLSGAALIFRRNRTNKPREPPVEPRPASVPEPGSVYEEIRDEGRPPPAVEICPVYLNVTYNRTQPVRAGEDDDSVTAATSQHKADDRSGSLTYSQVNFLNLTARSANRTPSGNYDDVVYSVLQKMT